jgi:hypothetical protein
VSSDLNRYAVAFADGTINIRSRNFEDEENEDMLVDAEERDMELLE